jgi:hypothetical protein
MRGRARALRAVRAGVLASRGDDVPAPSTMRACRSYTLRVASGGAAPGPAAMAVQLAPPPAGGASAAAANVTVLLLPTCGARFQAGARCSGAAHHAVVAHRDTPLLDDTTALFDSTCCVSEAADASQSAGPCKHAAGHAWWRVSGARLGGQHPLRCSCLCAGPCRCRGQPACWCLAGVGRNAQLGLCGLLHRAHA